MFSADRSPQRPAPLPHTSLSERTQTSEVSPQDVDLAAERVLAVVDAACESAAGLLAQLDAALASSLALLSAEPEVAHCLVCRSAEKPTVAAQRAFEAACAARLRAAAERAGAVIDRLPFIERYLIAAVQSKVTHCLRENEMSLLPDLVPDLRDFIFAMYSEIGAD
ncbi:MAG: hypothetical protein ACJ76B_07670 [Solirubrobacterales bacterium]